MKKIILIILILSVWFSTVMQVFAESEINLEAENTITDVKSFEVSANSAILIDAESGKILFSQNENEKASPASVTKIMTLLLVVEAIECGVASLEDKVSVSAYAASMGGSQVFLEEGEIMMLEELLKCTVIASANDAAVALAEHISGSEVLFVQKMNERARELGMENTNFENVTGLDDTTESHLTSAKDIAIMSCELIKYPIITKYSSLWQDSIRNGEFTLTNTNRLVRYYDGCNGLKTGSTDKAGYCISVSAKRGDLQLIAVIMGAKTRDIRNKEARELLDFGFAGYGAYTYGEQALEKIPIKSGTKSKVMLFSESFRTVVPKKDIKNVETVYDIPKRITAPISEDEKVGTVTFKLGDEILGECDIVVKEKVDRISFFYIFGKVISFIFCD